MESDRFDLIVVGSGAAGLAAASAAAALRLRVLLVEASDRIGGTTAISGGMVWIPANHKMAEAGLSDSLAAARRYLDATLPASADHALREAFLTRGAEAIRFLETATALRLRPVRRYPDYYPDLPGATAGGRVLEPVPFDGAELGDWFARLRAPLPEFMLLGGMMIAREDLPHLRRMARSPASAWHVARLFARYARQRLSAQRGTTLYLGNALAARLLQSALALGVQIRLGTAVERLRVEAGRVVGVELVHGGDRRAVRATRGVVLATGGLSHDAPLRQRHVPPHAGALSATVSSGANTGGARLAVAVGARLTDPCGRHAFWVPVSTFTRADGTKGLFPHTVTDRAKPGLIAVDQGGRRFVNEALSYHEFVQAQLRAGERAIPAFLVCDASFLWKFGLGCVRPFSWSVRAQVARGALVRSATLAGLAQALGIPAGDFEATVGAYNEGARRGVDAQFGRGGDIYQRHLGDADHAPNPCVAPIETPPYCAVAVRPADLGMAAGIVTDTDARALDAQGMPIPGLYACGNDMHSVMDGAYPGPGITLGPALVFATLAARHAAGTCANTVRQG